jgi:hypothetical protein
MHVSFSFSFLIPLLALSAPQAWGQPGTASWNTQLEKKLARAVKCTQPLGAIHRNGEINGQPFHFVHMSCAFEGGNSSWAAGMVAFHDQRRITRASVYDGLLAMSDDPLLVNGTIVQYKAIVAKPDDSRCCPSGSALVSIDTGTMRVKYRAIGFAANFPDDVGRAIKP